MQLTNKVRTLAKIVRHRGTSLAIISVFAFLIAPAVSSATAFAQSPITEYPLTSGSTPLGFVKGPDGAVWFTEYNSSKIGRIATDGTLTEFPLPENNANPRSITVGPDSALWFTESGANQIGRITTSGAVTEFPVPMTGGYIPQPYAITSGPDGNLWFTEFSGNKIGRMTTAGALTEYQLAFVSPTGIAVGSDGALWFGEYDGNKIGRLSTSLTSFNEYSIPTPDAYPIGMALGSDGAIWFAEHIGGKIGRISPTGAFTEYQIPTPSAEPIGITAGPDGALWFTELNGNNVGRLTTAGTFTEYAIPTAYSEPTGITTGSDGNLWFGEEADKVGKLTLDQTPPVVTVTPVAGSTLSGTVTFNITVTDDNPLDPTKNTAVWVYMYNTAGTQKSWGSKVNLSSGSGTFTIDTTKLDNGNANLDVGKVYDAAGNPSGRTDTYFRNYTISN